MNIPELIKEAHGNTVERGFYPEGKEQNIGEKLMLIVSELGGALEAHRCGRFSLKNETTHFVTMFTLDNVEKDHIWISEFESKIEDTFEDEIADVFIRLFDLCGYFGIDRLQKIYTSTDKFRNVGESLYNIVTSLPLDGGSGFGDAIFRTYSKLINLCEHMNIPIEKHIKAKMAYNRTRPHKHGKEY